MKLKLHHEIYANLEPAKWDFLFAKASAYKQTWIHKIVAILLKEMSICNFSWASSDVRKANRKSKWKNSFHAELLFCFNETSWSDFYTMSICDILKWITKEKTFVLYIKNVSNFSLTHWTTIRLNFIASSNCHRIFDYFREVSNSPWNS